MPDQADSLNPNHLRRLRTTCEYIDKLLSNIEDILWASESKAAFPKYIPDISPAQRRVIEDYIARIRSRLLRTLESQGIAPERPTIPASRALRSDLTFVDIAVEELRPRYMRGYGEIPPKAAAELNGIVGELQGLVARLDEYVCQKGKQDLQKRLERLTATGADLSLLQTLERIINRHGLVEFRASLSLILDRLEDKTFEIAIFGRVSSGKSSLLNAILETDLLPVGVTPITAVPTRLGFGDKPLVRVWYADSRPAEVVDLARLGEFVTEQHNPENRKHVSRIVVQLPSPALREGIVFVDTPGLGSLAATGAAETMAYLPKCDLGVVLIDASSSLTPNDLQTVQALYEAAVPASLLLSKADLLSDADRCRIIEYTKQHIHSELGLELKVHPVSVMASHRRLLAECFEHEIAPLYGHREELRMQSLQRKMAVLRDSVGRALRMRLNRTRQVSPETHADFDALDRMLRAANARIEESTALVERIAESVPREAADAMRAAALRVIGHWSEGKIGQEKQLVGEALLQAADKYATALQQALRALAEGLSSALADTARSLGISDAPGLEEFAASIREMPTFDPTPFATGVKRPTLARALGKSLERKAVERQVQQQLGAQFRAALETYAALLKSWGDSVIGSMRHLFETYADAYRAQLEWQLPEQKGADRKLEAGERAAILEDLQALGLAEEDVVAPTGV